MERGLCRTRPEDWWEFGDAGNRLALTLCRVACPVLEACAARDPGSAGVIRAAVAWTNAGKPAAMCPCGRPIVPKPSRISSQCIICDPPKVPIPPRRRGRPRKHPVTTRAA